jgi:hypothetical protein
MKNPVWSYGVFQLRLACLLRVTIHYAGGKAGHADGNKLASTDHKSPSFIK